MKRALSKESGEIVNLGGVKRGRLWMKFGFPTKLLAERELYSYVKVWRSINCLVPVIVARLVIVARERESSLHMLPHHKPCWSHVDRVDFEVENEVRIPFSNNE